MQSPSLLTRYDVATSLTVRHVDQLFRSNQGKTATFCFLCLISAKPHVTPRDYAPIPVKVARTNVIIES